jgi:hypothetical protein
MKAGSTTPSLKWRGQERIMTFQFTKTICWRSDVDAILRSSRFTYRTLHVQGDQSQVPCMGTSLWIIWDQSWEQNIMDCSVLMSYCCMTLLSHILPTWQFSWTGTFNLSVSLICCICLISPLVTIISLVHSRHILNLGGKTSWSDEEMKKAVNKRLHR